MLKIEKCIINYACFKHPQVVEVMSMSPLTLQYHIHSNLPEIHSSLFIVDTCGCLLYRNFTVIFTGSKLMLMNLACF